MKTWALKSVLITWFACVILLAETGLVSLLILFLDPFTGSYSAKLLLAIATLAAFPPLLWTVWLGYDASAEILLTRQYKGRPIARTKLQMARSHTR